MALKLLLLLNKAFYEPDEAVHATVQIVNDSEADAPALVRQLSFQASGFERTDPSWIFKLYKPEYTPEKSESRKRVRTLFSTENTVLLSSSILPHRAAQEFHLRLKLPAVLPPSFRGSSVRFNYIIEVKAVYELSSGSELPSLYETTTTSNFLVWPSASPRPFPSIQSGRTASTGGTALAGASSSALPRSLSGAGAAPAAPSTSGDGGSSTRGSGGGASAAGSELEGSTSMIEYRLQQTGVRVRFQEVPPEELTMALINSEAVAASPMQFHHTNQLAGMHTPHHNKLLPLPQGWKPEPEVTRPTTLPSGGSLIDPAGIPPSLPGHRHSGALSPSPGPAAAANSSHHRHHHHRSRRRSSRALNCSSDESETELVPNRLQHQMSTSSYVTVKGNQQQQGQQQGQQQQGRASGQADALSAGGTSQGRSPPSLFGRTFILNALEQPVLRLSLQPPLEGPLQPGATFGCFLDFRRALQQDNPSSPAATTTPTPVRCHQLLVLLETEEVVGAEYRSKGASMASGGGGGVTRKLYCEHQEIATDVAISSFIFTIPASATPSFRTPLVSLRWLLRFELTVGPALSSTSGAADGGASRSLPAMQQLIWSLPLLVVAPVMPVR